jgi:hypothetical protein
MWQLSVAGIPEEFGVSYLYHFMHNENSISGGAVEAERVEFS